jgi:hypothetical protein
MKNKHGVDVGAQAIENEEDVAQSARVLSATIVVMQKLARTLNAAEKPRKSIPDILHSRIRP